MNLTKTVICLCLIMVIPQVFYARGMTYQQAEKKVKASGKVTDENGEGIPGAAVKIIGTNTGTVTNLDGVFSLTVPDGSVLEVVALNYATQTVTVTGTAPLNIVLKEDALRLDELVVVGYGTQNKAKITGSVSTVSTFDLKDRPITDVSLALQGKVSGVQVTQNSGMPGEDGGTVTIRGLGTLNNSSPLVIVDGFESSFDMVNPKDIESITVLKDAASAAIYGNKAANGVILITTKAAKAQKMKVSYSGYGAVQQVTHYPKLLNSVEYLTLYNEACINSGKQPTYNDEYIAYFDGTDPAFYPDHDWAEWYLKPALMHNHHVGVNGGTKEASYSASLGYLGQDGMIVGTKYDKINFLLKSVSSFFDGKVSLDTKISGYRGRQKDLPYGTRSVLSRIINMPPTTIPYYEGYGYGSWFTSDAAYAAGGAQTTDQYCLTGAVNAYWNIGKGFSLSASSSYDMSTSLVENYEPMADVYIMFTAADGTTTGVQLYNNHESSVSESTSKTESVSAYVQLSYWKRFASSHTLSAMAGFQCYNYDYKYYNTSSNRLATNIPSLNAGDPETVKTSNDASSASSLSGFSRIQYDYKEKYLLEFNFRADGSSKFSTGHKWGFFPSASAGWRLTQEDWMKSQRWVDELKIRGSYGILGNQNIWSNYAGMDVLTIGGPNYCSGGKLNTGAYINYLASKDLSWETTAQANIGIDFYFLHVFSLTVDLYSKRTYDILMRLPVSKTFGFTEYPYKNAGSMLNRGCDVDLQYYDTFGKLRLKLNGTFSINRNKIIDLHGQSPIIDSASGIILKEGYPINSLYGFETDGIYQSEGDIKQHLATFDKDGNVAAPYCGLVAYPGDIKFVDQNGDGVISLDDDRVILGSPNPDFLYSFSANINYGRWDFTAFFQGVQGGIGWSCEYCVAPFYNQANCAKWMINRWTEEKPNNTYQRVFLDDQRAAIKSRYYAEDMSYLRLKNLELGYSLKYARFYISGQNIFTLTRFKGFDPERSGVSSSNIYDYPLTKTWTIGVNINF